MASLLQQIRDCNSAYRAGTPRMLDESGDAFVVLACIDPRLTGFLEPALGLPRHRALVIRVSGNQILESSTDVLRSIAAAAYIKNATELFVVGHTDCALTRFSASDVIDRFRRAGIPRSVFGDGDLRAWFGAFPDIRANVLVTIAHLRRSGILPRGFKVHGIILGTEDAALEVVFDGDASQGESPPVVTEPPKPPGAETRPEAIPAVPLPPPQKPNAPAKHPVIIAGSTPFSGRPAPPAAMVLRDFFLRESRDAHFQHSLAELRRLVTGERNPAHIIRAVERLVKEYRTQYPDLPGALEYLKEAVESEGTAGTRFIEFMRRILE